MDFAKIDAVVDNWFNTATHNGPIARNTEAFAQLFAAKDGLKADLRAALAPEPPSATS